MAQDNFKLAQKLFNYTNTHNIPGMIAGNQSKIESMTFNPRYPGFDEQNYRKLESKIDDLGLVGNEREKAMDQLYVQVLPQVQNQIINSDRRKYINDAAYEVSQIQNKSDKTQAKSKLTVTELAQQLKEKFNIDPTANDEEVFNSWIESIPNGGQLLADYMNDGDPQLLYQGGLIDSMPQNAYEVQESEKTTQGGRYGLMNPQFEGKVLPNASELVNPVGYVTETLDNAATKFANKLLVTGEGNAQDLADKISSMSPEEIEAYRNQYKELLKNKDWRTARVEGDTVVERLRNGIKGDTSYDYTDEGFMGWLISQKANLGESLIGADEILKGDTNPNVIRFVGNLPSSALKTFTATIRGMTNPYDTLKGLYKLAATEEGHKALLNRYGSWDNIAKAMNEDPVGVADDALAIANVVGGVAKTGLNAAGKVTGSQGLIDKASSIGRRNPGSANDVLAQKTLGGVYGAMDYLAGDSKILQGVNRYAQDTSSVQKLTQNVKSDLSSIKRKAGERADTIIQNNNRMTKKQQENFKKMSGEDQGKWMNDRGMRTQEDLVDYFLESKRKVDDAMGRIEGQFTSKELTTVLDDSVDFAKKTENQNLSRLQELQTKNANGGLTMQEINEVKRFYERNNKFNYLKEGTAEKSALATNRDTALRERQQKIATENGLDNLKELNKEIQASKFLADNATNWQSGVKGNNPISLTDWIVASGGGLDVAGIRNVVGKKIFSSPRFQNKLVDVLNYVGGRETRGAVNPNYEAIDMKNSEKRFLAEELAKVKNEKQFNTRLERARETAGPALPYDARYDGQAPIDYSIPTTVTPGGQSVRVGQIAEI